MYLSFDVNDSERSTSKTQLLSNIHTWMLTNKLKVNDEKAEFLLIASPHSQPKIKADHHLKVEHVSFPTSSSA